MTSAMATATTEMTTSLMNLLSPTAMHSLGWALLHFLWQGTALAALAAAAMALCRRAAARYVIGVGALALMLLAPLATFVFIPSRFIPSRFIPSLSIRRDIPVWQTLRSRLRLP